MLPRVPSLLRYSRARMSSTARSSMTIDQVRVDVNAGTAPRQTSASNLAHQVPLCIKEIARAGTGGRLARSRKAEGDELARGADAGDVTRPPSRITCSAWMDRLRLLTPLERPVRNLAMQPWIVQGFERCPYNKSWADQAPRQSGGMMNPNRLLTRALGMLAVASILVSCSSPQSTSEALLGPSPSKPPATSTTQPSTRTAVPSTMTPPPPTATAPEPYAVVTEAQQIIGTWKFSESDFTRFYEDGTYHDAYSIAQLDPDPYAVNKYEFEDGHLVAREVSVSGVPPCGGKVGSYEIRLLRSGKLQIIVIRDACGPRVADTQGIYERVP
jgi:hypothetical protein